MTGTLDPADPQVLLRRIAALERRFSALKVVLTGAQYDDDESGARTVASGGSFQAYTGAPAVTLVVPDSGRVRVSFGFAGWNSATGTSTVRVGVVLSGANTAVATTAFSACGAGDNIGAGTDPLGVPRSASRSKMLEGLTPGSTTFTLQGRVSTLGNTHSIQDSWLLVEPLP